MPPRLRSHAAARRLTVQSFHADDVAVLAAALPGARSSLLVAGGRVREGLATAEAIGADAVGLPWPFTPDDVEDGRERGLAVMAYTVNDPDAVRAAARAGVDAVITDDPCAARLALAEERADRPGRAVPALG